jgi:hypothetical protein
LTPTAPLPRYAQFIIRHVCLSNAKTLGTEIYGGPAVKLTCLSERTYEQLGNVVANERLCLGILGYLTQIRYDGEECNCPDPVGLGRHAWHGRRPSDPRTGKSCEPRMPNTRWPKDGHREADHAAHKCGKRPQSLNS